jgi:hypothetical protein
MYYDSFGLEGYRIVEMERDHWAARFFRSRRHAVGGRFTLCQSVALGDRDDPTRYLTRCVT